MKSVFPVFDFRTGTLNDGTIVPATPFCKRTLAEDARCRVHYQSTQRSIPGYLQCPFGFTTRAFDALGERHAITGVIGWPRFDTANERALSKQYPQHKVPRVAIEGAIEAVQDLDRVRADAIQEAAQILPQSLHELRKLNGAVLQHAEKELRDHGNSSGLQTILSAAELMRNNFDVLEALSNIESMRAIPLDDTVNLFDLAYKTKKVYLERAKQRTMTIAVNGVRPIIRGNKKAFPIVPTILIENAIKYGRAGTHIRVATSAVAQTACLTVENETDFDINTEQCFERGTRYAGKSVEGGGFGLFLAREIVSAHKGTIHCGKSGDTVRIEVRAPLVSVLPGY